MGLPLRHAQLAVNEEPNQVGPSQTVYKADETPAEKVGWHETEESTTPAMPPPHPTSDRAIDISRLVTLPPPYPRHYPAVQNQHPDLHTYRTLVRNVCDLNEIEARHTRYQSSIEALRKEQQARIDERSRKFRVNMQAQIQEGSISYAEAAEAEAAMKVQEQTSEKERVQAEFDSFQDVVLNPLHDLLTSRIGQTTYNLHELQSKLLADTRLHNPDETQSAGDERPELLEQLTQLKWLFEAREQLHREVFKLLTERNEKYQVIVTLPYKQCGNKDKIRETTRFFAQDNQDRAIAFENGVVERNVEFLSVIEANVLHGVEVQLSAFWDIAPSLLAVCQKVPDHKSGQDALISPHRIDSPGRQQLRQASQWPGIQIPVEEVQENPSYRQYPMQYLYSLLLHAERSTYQFIESQVNLLCLLHEARTGVMAAKVRQWEIGKLAHVSATSSTVSCLASPVATSFTSSSLLALSLAAQSPLVHNTPDTARQSDHGKRAVTHSQDEDGPKSASRGATTNPPELSFPTHFHQHGDNTSHSHPPRQPQESGSESELARIRQEASRRRAAEEDLLTADLKERVQVVESQWSEALGLVITDTRERVKQWLESEGGWDAEVLEQ